MRTAAAIAAAAAVLSYLDHAQQNKTHGAWIGTTPRYRTYGDRAKPPLVVIPGLDGCTVFFSGVIPELVRDFFVVVYDLPLYHGQNYTFSYLANDVASALDELAIDRASIVGESFGGVVAQHVALEHSERVEALVLLSSLAKTELTAVVKFKLHCLLPLVEFLGRAFPGTAQTIFAKVHASDVVEASEPAWARSLFVKEASWAHHASVMQRIKIVAGLDIEDRVPSIAQPVLLVRGAEDTFTGHTTARLQSLLRRVDVVTLPGGHLPHVTSSLGFARVARDFLLAPGEAKPAGGRRRGKVLKLDIIHSKLEHFCLPATADDKLVDFRLVCLLFIRVPLVLGVRPPPFELCQLRARSCEREHVCGSKLVALVDFELSQHRCRLSTGYGVSQAGGQVRELDELERLQRVVRKSGDDVRICGILGGDDEARQGANAGEVGKPTRSRKRRLLGDTYLGQPWEAAGSGKKRLRTNLGAESGQTTTKRRNAIAQGSTSDGLDDVGEDVTPVDINIDGTRGARGLGDRVESRRTISVPALAER